MTKNLVIFCFSGDYEVCDPSLTDDLVQHLSNVFSNATRSYSFIYLANVDNNGHFSIGGWCGTQYSDALATVDLQVRKRFEIRNNNV